MRRVADAGGGRRPLAAAATALLLAVAVSAGTASAQSAPAPSGAAFAQSAAVPPAAASAPAAKVAAAADGANAPSGTAVAAAPVQSVVITGNPLRDNDVTTPVSTLGGDGLVLRRGSTLGETLDGLPGVSSSYFGPTADRPVIRGQDGDRIRILSNAGASLDASSLSYDHAVPIDPLAIERVEVLRGPAALLYGGSAVGGVVNTIDNRIPKGRLDEVSGAAEVRVGGPAGERGASALVETGDTLEGTGFAVHADGFWRETDDLRVPTYDRPTEDGGTERVDRVLNSASRAHGGAVGASWVGPRGYLGASADAYRNDYGSVAEEGVTIAMKRDRAAVAGELRDIDAPIRTVRGQVAYTEYEHQEIEASGDVGTTFKNRGTDSRFELEHRPVALAGTTLRGIFGLQTEDARFSALGEEAFVPSTKTSNVAAFVYEDLALGGGKMTLGLRSERVRIDSAGDEGADEPRFGPPQQRRFTPFSGALGALWPLTAQWQLTGNLAYSERAPTFYELFANGLHVATGTYERGNAAMALEKGTNLDVALQWKPSGEGIDRLRIGAFASRFSNYITLLNTGETATDPESGQPVPIYAFTGVPAELHGLELEGAWRAIHGATPLDLDAKLDWIRGRNRDTGEPLPRLAPLRVTLGAETTVLGWTARAEVVHADRQDHVPTDDTPTPGYTLVNLSASRKLQLFDADALVFVKANNVSNELAYNAATIATVRTLAPLPGRGVMAGLRVAF